MVNVMNLRGGGMSMVERMLGLRGRDFRMARWGFSSNRVRKLETALPFLECEDLLVFKSRVLGKPVEVVYLFNNDRLVRTKYVFTSEPADPYERYKEYVTMVYTLTAKYGPPVYKEQLWHDTLFRNNKNFIGEALINGHVSFYSQWCLGTTFITHVLANGGDEIKHEIEYCCTAHRKVEQVSDLVFL